MSPKTCSKYYFTTKYQQERNHRENSLLQYSSVPSQHNRTQNCYPNLATQITEICYRSLLQSRVNISGLLPRLAHQISSQHCSPYYFRTFDRTSTTNWFPNHRKQLPNSSSIQGQHNCTQNCSQNYFEMLLPKYWNHKLLPKLGTELAHPKLLPKLLPRVVIKSCDCQN